MDASEGRKQPRILCIYGNPKRGGFVHGCVDHIAGRLEGLGAQIDRLVLSQCDLRYCTGCFHCLRTGNCSIDDQGPEILDRIRQADGMVCGASVRNGSLPALFKTFYERITYLLGFGRELRGKYVLAVGAVGMATGRRQRGRFITLGEFRTYVSDYLFFRTGIPTRRTVEAVAPRLDRAADRFYRAVRSAAPLPWTTRALAWIDDFIIRKFMLEPNPQHVYDYIIARWKQKGLL